MYYKGGLRREWGYREADGSPHSKFSRTAGRSVRMVWGTWGARRFFPQSVLMKLYSQWWRTWWEENAEEWSIWGRWVKFKENNIWSCQCVNQKSTVVVHIVFNATGDEQITLSRGTQFWIFIKITWKEVCVCLKWMSRTPSLKQSNQSMWKWGQEISILKHILSDSNEQPRIRITA